MKIESGLLILLLAALIMKLFHLPGSIMFLVLLLIHIAILYLVLSFYLFCDKILERQNLAFSIISGIFLSIVPIGILFKVMYWDDGQQYVLIAAIVAAVFLALSFLLKSKAPEHLINYYNNMVLRTGILTAISIFLFSIPAATLINFEFKNDPELAKLKILQYNNPANLNYKKQLNESKLKVDSLDLK
ncbi:MAG: hypothetical protein M3Q56_06000 [Bacteroidota bacterium]|nr:hypothetical protein [Bacteroidota bacterium]